MSRRSRMSPGKQSSRKSNGSRVIVGLATTVDPPPLPEGKHRCPVCRNAATPTPTGKLYKHRDLFGDGCWNREPAEGDEVPTGPRTLAPNAHPEHTREALLEAVRSGTSPYRAGLELGVNETTARKWCDEAGVARRRYHRQDSDEIALAGRWVQDGLIMRHVPEGAL